MKPGERCTKNYAHVSEGHVHDPSAIGRPDMNRCTYVEPAVSMYVVDFEVSVVAASGSEAYATAIEKLTAMLAQHHERGIVDIFNKVPNGGVDGSKPGERVVWKCIFGITEKED